MNFTKQLHPEIKFTNNDVVNLDDWLYDPELIPFLMHDHSFTICIVFAENLQDALDKAVDDNKLDRYAIDNLDFEDYTKDVIIHLGNASEPFDLESLEVVQLPVISPSFTASYYDTSRMDRTAH